MELNDDRVESFLRLEHHSRIELERDFYCSSTSARLGDNCQSICTYYSSHTYHRAYQNDCTLLLLHQ